MFQFFVNFALKQTEHISDEAKKKSNSNFTLEWVQVDSSSHSDEEDGTLNLSDGNYVHVSSTYH